MSATTLNHAEAAFTTEEPAVGSRSYSLNVTMKEFGLLTTRHLAVIRAALQFFDEEMSPHGPDVSAPYFEDLLEENMATDEVWQLRELLRNCQIKYLYCDRTGTTVIEDKLLAPEEALSVQSRIDGRIATVILSTDA